MKRNLSIIYNAPCIETIELVLENGIAFTITKEGSQIEGVEEGDGWEDF